MKKKKISIYGRTKVYDPYLQISLLLSNFVLLLGLCNPETQTIIESIAYILWRLFVTRAHPIISHVSLRLLRLSYLSSYLTFKSAKFLLEAIDFFCKDELLFSCFHERFVF